MAGNLKQAQASLLVGQMDVTAPGIGTAPFNTPIAVGSPALGQLLFGQGSMLDRMIKAFFKVNVNQLMYAIAVPDPPAGVKATGTILCTAPPTAPGTLFLYIAGQLVQLALDPTDTTANVATELAAAINAMPDLPVTAVATTASVALTCNWKGSTGNDITIIPNLLGPVGGQIMPAGLALTITPMASGTSQPDMTAAIAAISAYQFFYVGMPYTDDISQLAWATEYGFGSGGLWNYSRQQYGFVMNAYRNDYVDTITWGMAQNAAVISSMAVEQLVPSPVWEIAAAYCGLASLGFSDDPARPLQTLELLGIVPAALQNRYDQAEQNNLVNSGLAAQAVDPNGNMMIMVEASQYQRNAYGQSDDAYFVLTTLATLAALLSRMKSAITNKYPRVKLVPNGTAYGPGQAIVTPAVIAAELVSEYRLAIYDGLASGLQAFGKNLIVEIDDQNPNRVNVEWPGTLAGQLRVFAMLAEFRLLASPVAIG
jgi:phage tail sheath gpL-like